MPEHIRALLVILALAIGVFAFMGRPARTSAISAAAFARRRNIWLAITLIAFFAHNFWVFIVATALLLLVTLPLESNRLALFYFLLFAIPAVDQQIAGIGGIKQLFSLTYVRLLALIILLPTFLVIRTQPDVEKFGRSLPDKFLIGYVGLNLCLMLTVTTFTNSLRHGVLYPFIDVVLPYYIASRAPKNLDELRDVLASFVIASVVLGAIALFETPKGWLLYAGWYDVIGARWGLGNYLGREETLRAQGTTGHPIVFGYVMVVAIGFLAYLKQRVGGRVAWRLGAALLLLGLCASLSRGPWVGVIALVVALVALGRAAGARLLMLGGIGALACGLYLGFSVGERFVEYLPFVGTVEAENVTYRQRLLEVAVQVILDRPFFGAYDYIYLPVMQELRQGQGIIDVVNSYVGVALSSGITGLVLFCGFFFFIGADVFKVLRQQTDKDADLYRLGQALLAILVAVLLIIFTVSSISIIPTVYWSLAGLCVAYVRLTRMQVVPEARLDGRLAVHPA